MNVRCWQRPHCNFHWAFCVVLAPPRGCVGNNSSTASVCGSAGKYWMLVKEVKTLIKQSFSSAIQSHLAKKCTLFYMTK